MDCAAGEKSKQACDKRHSVSKTDRQTDEQTERRHLERQMVRLQLLNLKCVKVRHANGANDDAKANRVSCKHKSHKSWAQRVDSVERIRHDLTDSCGQVPSRKFNFVQKFLQVSDCLRWTRPMAHGRSKWAKSERNDDGTYLVMCPLQEFNLVWY